MNPDSNPESPIIIVVESLNKSLFVESCETAAGFNTRVVLEEMEVVVEEVILAGLVEFPPFPTIDCIDSIVLIGKDI